MGPWRFAAGAWQLDETAFRRFDLDLRPATAAPLTYRFQVRAEVQQDFANSIDGEGLIDLSEAPRLELAAMFEDLDAGILQRLVAAPGEQQPWSAGKPRCTARERAHRFCHRLRDRGGARPRVAAARQCRPRQPASAQSYRE